MGLFITGYTFVFPGSSGGTGFGVFCASSRLNPAKNPRQMYGNLPSFPRIPVFSLFQTRKKWTGQALTRAVSRLYTIPWTDQALIRTLSRLPSYPSYKRTRRMSTGSLSYTTSNCLLSPPVCPPSRRWCTSSRRIWLRCGSRPVSWWSRRRPVLSACPRTRSPV